VLSIQRQRDCGVVKITDKYQFILCMDYNKIMTKYQNKPLLMRWRVAGSR